ncbi:putative glycosyltransferase EpsJ [Halomonas sp. THAF12]|uniref:glycosyltransferase family 2 protein n=1 Tax=Halomonas sp. THAF12 TaxID=2587849 RepID=UPI0012694C0F|nr:glycosyltransferase family A protein [Halomonas sp. THAF12]QFT84607.1 putative glycosyltransferase EpsJ [Halomonas sp. THAF12]
MTSPRFSVVIPVYNGGEAIDATLGSVLDQRETDFEVWLVNDGSTDDTLQRLTRWQRRDARIHVIDQANGGVARARNAGAAHARGELIAFLDADDLWAPDKLEAHAAFHERHRGVEISYARIAFLHPDDSGLEAARTHSTVPTGALALEQALGENPVCTTSNLVVTRACWQASGGFREGMQHAEDQEWLARAIAGGARAVGLQRVLVGYRLSTGGLSADLPAMYAGWRRLSEAYAEGFDVAAARALYCRYLARRALRAGGSSTQAWGFALEGLKSSPGAFLKDRRRGALTVIGALVSPLLPRAARMRLFA